MDSENTKAATREPLADDPVDPNGWDDPFERWIALADLLLHAKVDSKVNSQISQH